MPKIWRKDNFPGGSDGKECACNADLGSVPGSGRSPGEWNVKNKAPLEQFECILLWVKEWSGIRYLTLRKIWIKGHGLSLKHYLTELPSNIFSKVRSTCFILDIWALLLIYFFPFLEEDFANSSLPFCLHNHINWS